MGYVYKYTHKETGKYYIGSHNGNKQNYTGSGLIWQRAKKKHGIESFDMEILYEGPNYRAEEELMLKALDAANDDMSYNMKNEAIGGSFPGEKNGMYGKTLTPEQRYMCGSGFRGKERPDHSEKMKGENNPMYGKSEHAHGIVEYSKSNIGKNYEEIFGEERAIEIKKRLSEKHKGVPKPGTSAAMKGAGNSSAKPVTIDGVEYGCIKDAMEATGLSRYKILKKVRSYYNE